MISIKKSFLWNPFLKILLIRIIQVRIWKINIECNKNLSKSKSGSKIFLESKKSEHSITIGYFTSYNVYECVCVHATQVDGIKPSELFLCITIFMYYYFLVFCQEFNQLSFLKTI